MRPGVMRLAKFQSCLAVFVACYLVTGVRSADEYSNQFAVHVPEGVDEARKVASKHGFAFHGQIGDLENYFLFEHNHVHKRSIDPSHEHHEKLDAEPQVAWFEQQVNKKRTKRDFMKPDLDEMPWEAAGILREAARERRFNAAGSFPFAPGFTPQPSHSEFQRSVVPSSSANSVNFRDPFYGEQWYLHGGARGGYDMNVINCWKRGYSGKGVVISILDDGIQRDHPELALNYDPYASFDINDKDPDPMPQDNGDNKHGTRCAGEVSAVADNDVCGVGIAFNSSIGGVRMLDGPVNDAVEAHALSLNPDHIDIYSASWGPEDDGKTVDGPGPLARRAFINGIMKGRKGKGSIFVWASGNGGRHVDNCNCDGYTNSIFTLSISSATQRGLKPWYLEECASTLATTYSSGGPSSDKSVVTCDQDARLRPDRMCTVEHTGTSASAPIAAGICALALEANPSLTWRDMQYLVVMTSRPEPVLGERGWIVNGVKRKVSHKFGYGMMDADAMVALAEKWSTVPSQHICQSRPDRNQRTIPAKYGGKMEASMSLDACAGTLNEVRYLEHVQCKISLRYLPRGNLRILLTSPMGTTSTLLFERPRDVTNANFDEWPFLSVHFWGEKADGTWVLQIINAGERRVAHPGLLRSWQLILYGTDINPVRLHSANARGKGLVASEADLGQSPSQTPAPFQTVDPHVPQPQPAQFNRAANPSPDFSSGFYPLRNSFPNIFTLAGSAKVSANFTSNVDVHEKAPLNCHEQCAGGCSGPGPANCHQCKNVKYDGQCIESCPAGKYADSDGVCMPCHQTCAACVGPEINQCSSCPSGKYYVLDVSLCVSGCPAGYLQDDESKVCHACSSHCSSCEGSIHQCTSCNNHLILHENQCFASCPAGYFVTPEFTCSKCDSSCFTCMGSGADQCISCPYPAKFLYGRCVPDCPDGYFTGEMSHCVKCKPGCSKCTDNRSPCSICRKGFTSDKNGNCVPEFSDKCPKGTFADGGKCTSCDPSCLTCFGKKYSQCLTCAKGLLRLDSTCVDRCLSGHYLEGSDCLECPYGCSNCKSANECLKCADGLHNQDGVCLASCNTGFYSDRGQCKSCHSTCATCTGPRATECVTCPSRVPLAGGSCESVCPNGFYTVTSDETHSCSRCHRSCLQCHGAGVVDCTACPINSTLKNGVCLACGSNQYYEPENRQCIRCHPSCLTCNGPDDLSCLSCAKPLNLDPRKGQCVTCCSPSFPSGQPCCQCDSNGVCVNSEHRTRYVHDPAEKMVQHPEKPSSLISSTGLLSILLLLVAIVVIVWAVYRSKRTPQSKYTYHQLPVDSRLAASGPAISELSWSASGPDKVRIGDLDSEDELDRRESVAT